MTDTKTAEERAQKVIQEWRSKWNIQQWNSAISYLEEIFKDTLKIHAKEAHQQGEGKGFGEGYYVGTEDCEGVSRILTAYGKSERRKAYEQVKKKVTALTISNPDDMYNTALCDVVVTIEELMEDE